MMVLVLLEGAPGLGCIEDYNRLVSKIIYGRWFPPKTNRFRGPTEEKERIAFAELSPYAKGVPESLIGPLDVRGPTEHVRIVCRNGGGGQNIGGPGGEIPHL